MNLPGLNFATKRSRGRVIWFIYAWRGGPLIMRAEGPTKPKLTAAAIAAYQDAHAKRLAAPADTLARLAGDWRASPEWRNLRDTTKATWGRCLNNIQDKFGNAPLGAVEDRRFRGDIMAWRASMAHTPRAADNHITVLQSLLTWGRRNGRLNASQAEDIPNLYKGGNRAHVIWEPHEIDILRPQLPPHVQDALDLARFTGLRRGDLVTLPLSAIGQHAIVWRTSKSNGERTVTVPMLPELKAVVERLRGLHRAKGVETALVNSKGQPWTPGGLTGVFNSFRDAAGFDKHWHDLRGTYVTELCPYLTDQQIAGIMGWSVTRIADIRRIYVDPARTVVAIGEALARRK